jgi:hypothetical protein
MVEYRPVFADEVVEIFHEQSARTRQWLLDLFGRMATNPHAKGQWEIRDASGRNNEVATFGRWQVTYWCDGAVKELRIVRIVKLPSVRRSHSQ